MVHIIELYIVIFVLHINYMCTIITLIQVAIVLTIHIFATYSYRRWHCYHARRADFGAPCIYGNLKVNLHVELSVLSSSKIQVTMGGHGLGRSYNYIKALGPFPFPHKRKFR